MDELDVSRPDRIRRGAAHASGQDSSSPRTPASYLATGHPPVHVPQAESGVFRASPHAPAGHRMENHHGADTGQVDHVIEGGDDPGSPQGMEDSIASIPGQRGGAQHCSATPVAGQSGSLEPHALVSCEAGPRPHGNDGVPVHGGDHDTRAGDPDIRGNHQDLQVNASSPRILPDRAGPVPDRDSDPRPRRQIVDYFQWSHRQCSAPPSGRKTASVRPESQPCLLGFPLCSISLDNPTSTTCHMNCSIHAVLHILALLQPQEHAALGQLCHLWGAIQRQPRRFDPSRNLQRVMLMNTCLHSTMQQSTCHIC